MRVIKSERTIFVDVDDTLIMHDDRWLHVTGDVLVKCRLGDGEITLARNEPMIRLVREEKQRGSHIIVWSRGGYQWAADVVTALGLADVVDEVYSKPLTYFDDKPISEWLTDRVYLLPDASYKNQITKD